MNIQLIIVLAVFAAAAFYIGRMLYRNIRPGKQGGACGGNCKCGFAESEKQNV